MRYTLLFTAVAFSALAARPAAAFFHVQHPPVVPIAKIGPCKKDQASGLRLAQVGTPGVVAGTPGFGHGLPLRVAGPLILPHGWKWRADPRTENTKVSWRAKEPWTQALLDAPDSVHYVVNWKAHSVAAYSSIPPVAVALAPKPKLPRWELYANRPLREQLQSWGRRAKWTVIWRGNRDVIVPASTVFRGTFPQVIQQVVNTLQAENGPVSVRAHLWGGNDTAVISITRSKE
ncbi:MAG: TcpQ domain-containing protein [Acidiferrobacterales bacterium]